MTTRRWITFAAILIALALAGGWALSALGERGRDTDAAAPVPSPSSSWPVAVQTAPADRVPGDGAWADPAAVDRTDPEAVAAAFAAATVQFDTTTDSTQTTAVLRARELMSAQMAATMVEPDRLNPAAGWAEAAQLEAYSSATVRQVGNHAHQAHEPGPAVAGRASAPYTFQVAWGWQGRDPVTTVAGGNRTVQLNLVQDEEGVWAVDGYVTEEPLTTAAQGAGRG